MRTRIKAALCLLLALAVAFSFGCADARELNDLVIVMGIGMDVDIETPGNVKLIAQVVLPQHISSSSDSAGSSEKAFVNINSTAANTFQAIRQYTRLIPGKLYIAHNQLIVIGRELAEQGISRPLDFFIRAKETRPTLNLLIADTTAEEVLSVQPELSMMPAIYLDQLVEVQTTNSQSFNTDLVDYVCAMQSKTLSLIVPIVRLTMNGENAVQLLEGTAVFKGDVMVGELSVGETRGVLWAEGKVQGGVINVGIDDGIASLEIAGSNASSTPIVTADGKVKISISISTELKLTEQTCTANLATQENMQKLIELVKQFIVRRIEQALEKAKALHADVFGFGELVHQRHNDVWSDMEPNWDEIFQDITLDIQVEASIVSVGAIEHPVWEGASKHEGG